MQQAGWRAALCSWRALTSLFHRQKRRHMGDERRAIGRAKNLPLCVIRYTGADGEDKLVLTDVIARNTYRAKGNAGCSTEKAIGGFAKAIIYAGACYRQPAGNANAVRGMAIAIQGRCGDAYRYCDRKTACRSPANTSERGYPAAKGEAENRC